MGQALFRRGGGKTPLIPTTGGWEEAVYLTHHTPHHFSLLRQRGGQRSSEQRLRWQPRSQAKSRGRAVTHKKIWPEAQGGRLIPPPGLRRASPVWREGPWLFRLQFATKPPKFNGVLMSVAEGEAAQVLQNEIDSLLLKRAIRVIPIEESQQGFYSRYFLIPKKGGSLRPILDLRVLNSHLRKYTFRMLTVKVLCQSIRPGDWFATIDLADAYFHIEIFPAHRKFLRLPQISCHAIGGEATVVQSVSGPVSTGDSGAVQTLSTAAGSDGVGHFSSEAGPPADEGCADVDCIVKTVSPSSPLSLGESFCRVLGNSPPVEKSGGFLTGCQPGDGGVKGCHNNGRVHVRLGRDIQGQSSEWRLVSGAGSGAYKLSRVDGSVSGLKTFSPSSEGAACAGEIRQLHGSGICEPSGRHALSTASQAGKENNSVERRSARVAESDARSRSAEQGRRSHVKRKPSFRGMETPSPGGEPAVAEIRPGCRRSVHLARKRALSAVFLTNRGGCAFRCRRAVAPMAKRPTVRISSSQPYPPHTDQIEGSGLVADFDSPTMAVQTLDSRDSSITIGPTLAPAAAQGPLVSGQGGDLPPPSGAGGSLGLARERLNLGSVGLPQNVIDTIQCARASSTRSLYSCKWRVFEEWCDARRIVSFQCSVRDILCFLQDLLEKGKAFSTIKVYLAAISACHMGLGDKPVGQHPLVCRFMNGVRRKLPVSRPMVPLWDLAVVLDALSQHPFEPLEGVGLKFLSLKTALLLALTTAKRVSDLQALSTRSPCLQFSPGLSKVCLRPNPAFIPKVVESAYRCPTVELKAFPPPPFGSAEESRLNALCPVRALRVYVDRTASFRGTDQLFVSWATPHKGKPLSRQRLSRWIVEAIVLAYRCRGLQPPAGLKAHSTRSMATSWALFKGIRVEDICAAASWSSRHTFVRFYRLNVSGPSLAHAVLESGASETG
ncbi:uncharacterized protein [Leuresthes tenuis]|uniref:uncharacterized protein n=1 Tax=Leuresthes tenuis TaxID=355514 RepID=UPI003B5126EE